MGSVRFITAHKPPRFLIKEVEVKKVSQKTKHSLCHFIKKKDLKKLRSLQIHYIYNLSPSR